MTPDEITIARALAPAEGMEPGVTYQAGTTAKQFAESMVAAAALNADITRRQSLTLLLHAYTFRRRLPKEINRLVLRNLMPVLDECVRENLRLNKDLTLLRLKVYQLKKAGGDLG